MSTTTVISIVDGRTGKVVRTVRKSGRSQRALLRIMLGLLDGLDLSHYYARTPEGLVVGYPTDEEWIEPPSSEELERRARDAWTPARSFIEQVDRDMSRAFREVAESLAYDMYGGGDR